MVNIPAVDINLVAVLIAAVVNMVIGMAWYSPSLFGKQWAKHMGFKMDSKEEMKKMQEKAKPAYMASFVGSLVMAYVLAHYVDYVAATTFSLGAQAGFWAWLGFIAPVMLSQIMFSGKPLALFKINVLYYLVVLLVNGAILAVWV